MKKFSGLSLVFPANAEVIEGNIKATTPDVLFVETMVGAGKKAALTLVTIKRSDVHHYGQSDEGDFTHWLYVGGSGKTKAELIESDVTITDLGNGLWQLHVIDYKLDYVVRADSVDLKMLVEGKIKNFVLAGVAAADSDDDGDSEPAPKAKPGAKTKKAAPADTDADDAEPAAPVKGGKKKAAPVEPEDEGDGEDGAAEGEDDGPGDVTQEQVDELDAEDRKSLVAAYNEHEDCEAEIVLKSLKDISKLEIGILNDAYDSLFPEGVTLEQIEALEKADRQALVKAYNEHDDVEDAIKLADLKTIDDEDTPVDLGILDAVYAELFGEGEEAEGDGEGETDPDADPEGDDDGGEPDDGGTDGGDDDGWND